MCHNHYQPWNSDDPTVRAIARGRAITASLARQLAPDAGLTPEYQARIAQGDREAWANSVDPAGGWGEPLAPFQVVTGPDLFTFGPGSLEALVLERRGVRQGGHPQVQARLSGVYLAYCGEGWTHRVDIATEWVPVNDLGPFSDADTSTWRDREAHALVELAMEAWACDCGPDPDAG